MAPTKKKAAPASKAQKATPRHAAEKEPEYMIQLADPAALRKDLLEGLREIIVFMQGYEQFRKIQDEKVVLFTRLKTEVREINSLIDNKLKKHFPKGKLKPAFKDEEVHQEQHVEADEEVSVETPRMPPSVRQSVPPPMPRSTPSPRQAPPAKVEAAPPKEMNELDELEAQLREIEGQLNSLK